MLEDSFSSWIVRIGTAFLIGSFVYAVWKGLRESKEEDRRVYGRLAELFETKPLDHVVRNLSKPNSSKVGSVELGGDSVITVVLSGPGGIFIDHKSRDTFYSIPWERIQSIDEFSAKRISLRIKGSAGQPTEIAIPWSKDMTFEGWARHKEQIG